MWILGISKSHNGAVALIHNGTIVSAVQAERLSRVKRQSLKLNEDLVEAASLGHDLGHTPFGHIGESVLNEILVDGFHHSRHSIRIIKNL